MANRQIGVDLNFNANISAAQTNLQKLKSSLSEISNLPITLGKNMSADLQQASQAAQNLQMHLNNAMNIKTGNLDLSKLEMSLQKSGQSLTNLTTGLLKAGTTGEQAFVQTYNALARTNIQLTKTNTLADRFLLTLKNTARWQLSSSLLTGIVSGFQSAMSYAKELNSSLNDIQIVTKNSNYEMAQFAKLANDSAKALKTTTTEYTKASLIYYQQGLNGKAVEERTNTTIKMANVTGKSAQEISSQMTAIWNNFDDGSKSLEHYADVLTKLGATTASSTDEIATGMQKFAAVAETVGLSYENATAALATVVAETRQSADVVGTAFKTLFSRMEQLKQGETLDDGTTLGQYSEALKIAGVNIKEASGELKSMDTIIDETGKRWQSLTNDQKVALAQQVAGIRQYQQFMALMNNYDVYKENINTAKNSDGELEKQQAVYEKSWDAAAKRVKASTESIFNDLIPTDTLISLTNGLAKVLDGVDSIIRGFGGLKTILLGVTAILSKKFAPQLAVGIETGIQKTKILMGNIVKIGQNSLTTGKEIIQSMPFVKNKDQSESVMTTNKDGTIQSNNKVNFEEHIDRNGNKAISFEQSGYQKFFKDIEGASAQQLDTIDNTYSAQFKNEEALSTAKEKYIQDLNTIESLETKITAIRQDSTKTTEQQTEAIKKLVNEEGKNLNSTTKEQLTRKENEFSRTKATYDAIGETLGESRRLNEESTSQDNTNSKKSYATKVSERNLAKEDRDQNKRTALQQDQYNALQQAGSPEYNLSESGKAQIKNLREIESLTTRIGNLKSKMTQEEREQYESQLENLRVLGEQTAEEQKKLDTIIAENEQQKQNIVDESTNKAYKSDKNSAELKIRGASATSVGGVEDKETENLFKEIAGNKASTSTEDGKMTATFKGADEEKSLQAITEATNNYITKLEELEQLKQRIANINDNESMDSETRKKEMDAIDSQIKGMKHLSDADKKAIKTISSKNKVSLDYERRLGKTGQLLGINTKEQNKLASGEQKVAKATQDVAKAQQKQDESLNNVKDGLDKVTTRSRGLGAAFSDGISSASQLAMGLNMITGALKDIKENGASLANISSLLMSIMPLLSGLSSVYSLLSTNIGGFTTALKVKNILSEKDLIITDASSAAKAAELLVQKGIITADQQEAISKALAAKAKEKGTALTWLDTAAVVANTLALEANPVMWIVTILVAIIAALVVIVSLISANNKAISENRKEQIENTKANLEAIDKNQELAESVKDLTKEYNNLKASGESTYETMQKLLEQGPELIKSYKELEEKMDIDLGVDDLQAAYDQMKLLGDEASVKEFTKVQEQVDKNVKTAEKKEAQTGAKIASEEVLSVMTEGRGELNGKTYSIDFDRGDDDEEGAKILREVFGDKAKENGSQIEVDMSDPKSVMDYYNKIKEVQTKMANTMTPEELANSDVYDNLKEEIKSLEENETIQNFKDLQDQVYTSALEEMNSGKVSEDLQKLLDGNFEKNRDKIIKKIAEEQKLTEEQAEKLLSEWSTTAGAEKFFIFIKQN